MSEDSIANRPDGTDPHVQEPDPKAASNMLLNTCQRLNDRQEMIRIISNRLFVALFLLLGVTLVGTLSQYFKYSPAATYSMVILGGAIGGFISLQRRLKTLDEEDLLLLARSWQEALTSRCK